MVGSPVGVAMGRQGRAHVDQPTCRMVTGEEKMRGPVGVGKYYGLRSCSMEEDGDFRRSRIVERICG